MNHPELSDQAWRLVRSGDPFEWHLITLLAVVAYIYLNEVEKGNWKNVAAGLSLYMVHWFAEIVNALVHHFSGHALWTVPAGTSFLLLIGVGAELSLMFSIAGLALTKILPKDPAVKILGVPNRIFFAVLNAAGFSIFEIFLARTPAFHWVYPWWGALPVFITVYIPFFLAANYAYDWEPKNQRRIIGGMAAVNAIMLAVFAGALGWI